VTSVGSTQAGKRTRGEPVALPIGHIAELSGLTIRAIRLYEERGLLKPARDRNGMRWFDAAATSKIVFIAQAREAGFSLADIKALAEGMGGPASASRSVCEGLVDRRLQALEAQRNALLRCCEALQLAQAEDRQACRKTVRLGREARDSRPGNGP
jgi:DNA-binding transcriptional MerR regulator